MTFAERFNEALELRNMRCSDITRLTGLSSSLLSMILSGKTKDPKFSTAIAIARALNVSLDWLGGLKDTPEVERPQTLSHSERLLVEDYRASIPGERAKLADYARERRAISQVSEAGSASSIEEAV